MNYINPGHMEIEESSKISHTRLLTLACCVLRGKSAYKIVISHRHREESRL